MIWKVSFWWFVHNTDLVIYNVPRSSQLLQSKIRDDLFQLKPSRRHTQRLMSRSLISGFQVDIKIVQTALKYMIWSSMNIPYFDRVSRLSVNVLKITGEYIYGMQKTSYIPCACLLLRADNKQYKIYLSCLSQIWGIYCGKVTCTFCNTGCCTSYTIHGRVLYLGLYAMTDTRTHYPHVFSDLTRYHIMMR